jgi:hypothetical protein
MYTKINLFGKNKSRGTFDDFYSTEKYSSLEEAYNACDYVEGNFVKDENNTIHIELVNISNPEIKKYHTLNIQRCLFGIDVLDDSLACEIAQTLL